MISVFDLFSIGIGPSSSHTVGPMRAAREFAESLMPYANQLQQITIFLYGSLACTGLGHGTDKAIVMGLMGEKPEVIEPSTVLSRFDEVRQNHRLNLLENTISVNFNIEKDLIYDMTTELDFHPNGMVFNAYDDQQQLLKHTVYYSVGGGFIINEEQRHNPQTDDSLKPVPFPFSTATELLNHCKNQNKSIAEIVFANELTQRNQQQIRSRILQIAKTMENCIDNGCRSSGHLPGQLKLKRRAPELYQKLNAVGKPDAVHSSAMSWLDLYAMAVNEENAAGGRIVTAPTNGAAGIVPAVLNYYKVFCKNADDEGVLRFLLTAGAIGILYKINASISGAEMGCQGEVGVACSMAAAGLAEALGATPEQVENAAEIGMEHNLGLTCDPVGGLVQIPCIERNAMGAVKAVNATQLAMHGNGEHKVSLDMVIQTMREIGLNMNSKYKETSKGGLAVNVPLC